MAKFVAVQRVLEMLHETGLQNGVLKVEGDGRLLAGPASGHLTHLIDLDKGAVEKLRASPRTGPPFAAEHRDLTSGRRSGVFAIEFGGRADTYPNLRALLIGTLRRLAQDNEDFLPLLAQEKGRTRHLVAKKPTDLFSQDKPHLAKKGAAPLVDGWWVNTNNSADAVKSWLKRAFLVAGIDPARDVRFSF